MEDMINVKELLTDVEELEKHLNNVSCVSPDKISTGDKLRLTMIDVYFGQALIYTRHLCLSPGLFSFCC